MSVQPEHVLPPITSSQTGVRSAASTICRGLTTESKRKSEPKVPPRTKPVRMTLAELEQQTEGLEEEDHSGWDVGEYLKENVSQVRKKGAGLAGAAMKAMSDGQSKRL